MGFFFSKPRVSPHEFQTKVRSELYSKGWPEHKINRVAEVVHGYLSADKNSSSHGMDAKDVEDVVNFLKTHHEDTQYSQHELDILHESLKKHL